MKIAIISYPYLKWFGGAERYVDELSKFLIKSDNEVTVIASKMTFSRGEKRKVKHCNVREIQTYSMPGKIPKAHLVKSFLKKCERYLMKHGHEFDVIDGSSMNALPAILSKPYHQRPVICTAFNTPWSGTSLEQEVEVYKRADGIIAFYEFVKRSLVDKYGIDEGKIRVIHVGVDLDRFNLNRYLKQVDVLKTSLGHETNLPFIFTLQRMDGRKDMNFIIGSLVDFTDHFDIPVYVGGAGPNFNEVKEQVKDHKGKIRLLGYINESELPVYYAASDIFIAATYGQVVLESLASETATILINAHPSCSEYIEDGKDGYLIDKDRSMLINKLNSLIHDKDVMVQFKNNGLRKVTDHFNWVSLTREILDFYKELCKSDL
ncbi:glycosyltransferase family 4 protein [Chloroflexota bacterium]